MVRTRSHDSVHAPRRLAPVVALILAFSTAILVAACSGGTTSSFGAGTTTTTGETTGLETPAASGY